VVLDGWDMKEALAMAAVPLQRRGREELDEKFLGIGIDIWSSKLS